MPGFGEPHLSDLAPGDLGCRSFEAEALSAVAVQSTDDPLFEKVYARLWAEFGEKGELESRAVLARRFEWSDPACGYEMIAVLKEGELIAARDHSVIVRSADAEAHVHLSHSWILPKHRGKGLAGWLRTWPVNFARQCARKAGVENARITLIAEMEPWQEGIEAQEIRLRSYSRAGFLKIDPARAPYLQPDFRDPSVIDASGGPRPLPLELIIRRVGLEAENELTGGEIRRIVHALYSLYEKGFRREDMEVVWQHARAKLPADSERVRLMTPVSRSTLPRSK